MKLILAKSSVDCWDLWQMLFVTLKLTGHLQCSWWWFLAIMGVELVARLRPASATPPKA